MRFAVECGIPQGLGLLLRSKDATAWHGYHLEEPYALIGTAEDCNVRLSDESIAPFHTYLQMLEGRLFVCDLTERHGVLLNDRPVTTDWVDRAAALRVGRYDLRIAIVEGPPQADAAAQENVDPHAEVKPLQQLPSHPGSKHDLILSMISGAGRVQQVRSSREISLVGRSRACKFHLGSSSVANFHCSLVRTSDSVWIVDLGSHDGTFLNGERVRRARVTGGSRIQVGRCRLDVDLQPETDNHAATSSALIPVGRSRPSPQQHLLSPPQGGYSEQLIRDLVADVASSQQAAFDHAHRMLVELISSQERVYGQQMESLKNQNEQLLEVIRMLASSREPQQIVVNLPQQAAPPSAQLPNALSDGPAPAGDAAAAEPAAPEIPPGPPPESDPEIHSAWVRGQLHVISENLKKEQERGVKRLLRGLMPGRSDDALR